MSYTYIHTYIHTYKLDDSKKTRFKKLEILHPNIRVSRVLHGN